MSSLTGFAGFVFTVIISINAEAQVNYAAMVNPFVGTGGHGHTFPGPTLPFGMVQVGPDTRVDGSWDGCSGYHYNDSVIYGFSHNHLSGTGCSDLGDVMIMPMAGAPSFSNSVYASKFSHATEKAEVGYYRVNLSDDNIDAELTATTRVGMHRYSFHQKGLYQVILDLNHRDKLLEGKITADGNRAIMGYRYSAAWGKDQRVFFRIEFSKPFVSQTEGNNGSAVAYAFNMKKGEKLLVKVSLSSADLTGAAKNMGVELPGWDFEGTRKQAEISWNRELSKIETMGGTDEERRIFYTALYHCFIHPSTLSDVDGRYMGRDYQIHTAKDYTHYTIFSLWDTFRALHPLFNLVEPQRNEDFIKTFLEQYKQAGRMPMWELWSNETDCMIGYHSVSIIADALAKGNDGFNHRLAVEACSATANYNHYGIHKFREKGYLSTEDEHESVSKSLEYAYDDWCYEQVLKRLGDTVEWSSGKFYGPPVKPAIPGAYSWQNVYNPKTGFMQARSNGGWYQPFNPKEVNNNYTEANSWQYTFFVPQNIPGLVVAMGGPQAFEQKLDELFSTDSKTAGRNQADISGLIGQYAHGNEPSHHMAYLYNYIGKPEKTRARVAQILKEMYHNAPDGLAGNEDCGQMSAWYVMSAMGFYPVTPGMNEYQSGTSLFSKVIIHSGRKDYVIESNSIPAEGENIREPKSADLFIVKGISNQPYDPPLFLPSPIIEAASKTFADSLLISVYGNNYQTMSDKSFKQEFVVTISTDSGVVLKNFVYKKPFYIYRSAQIEVNTEVFIRNKKTNLMANAQFYKVPNKWKIELQTNFSQQYTAGGAGALIDGMYGDKDWRKGGWQGYQGDLIALIDLGKVQDIHEFYADFLQDQMAWIVLPKEVQFYSSTDGVNYTNQGVIPHDIPWSISNALTNTFRLPLTVPTKARYIKVIGRNFGKLPKEHLSAGEHAWLFVDEIGVK